MQQNEFDASHMARALELAARGQGWVEPNPMVGCVIVRNGEIVGEGYHQRFGGRMPKWKPCNRPERAQRRRRLRHARTLLPPWQDASVHPGADRCGSAASCRRPTRSVRRSGGQGLRRTLPGRHRPGSRPARSRSARTQRAVSEARHVRRPWIIAKWAMTLDGKLATAAGDSRWISGEASRATVHRIRGRVDAIMVGRNTAAADDPLLTARPPGARVAARIVLDSAASLAVESRLVRTAGRSASDRGCL